MTALNGLVELAATDASIFQHSFEIGTRRISAAHAGL